MRLIQSRIVSSDPVYSCSQDSYYLPPLCIRTKSTSGIPNQLATTHCNITRPRNYPQIGCFQNCHTRRVLLVSDSTGRTRCRAPNIRSRAPSKTRRTISLTERPIYHMFGLTKTLVTKNSYCTLLYPCMYFHLMTEP